MVEQQEDSSFKKQAIKATGAIKVVGLLGLVAMDLFAAGATHNQTQLICAAIALLLPVPLALLNQRATQNTAWLVILVDLLLTIACYSQLASGQIAEPYLFILPLTLLQTSLYLSAASQLMAFVLVLVAVTVLQFVLLGSSLIGTTGDLTRTVVEFIDSSDWPCFVSALTACALAGYSLHFASAQGSTRGGRVPPRTVAALLLFVWSALMIAINNLANLVKYKGELVVEGNMHHVSLVLAVLLILLIGRVKRPLTTVLVLAIAAFFMTVAAAYSFSNGFELIYYLSLAAIALKSEGLKSKIGIALFILSSLLAVQINAHAIFADAQGANHPLFLATYTTPQITGVVLVILLLALTSQSKRTSATP
ncbi:MAG: hypothetical protein IPI39_06820 [Candidatus Obscuribacter sp.]|nr:hypothetical protein [Candidatus Obscuribacter sp.]